MSNRKQQKSVEEEFEEYGIPAVDSNGNEIGKSARKKLLVKAKKDSKKKEVATKQQQNQKQEEADTSVGKYGERPLIQSTERPKDKVFTQIKSLVAAKVGETVLLRARLHVVRIQAKMIFLVLRQQFSTIQAVCIRPQCSTQMLNFIKKIATESIVDVTGTIVAPQEPIKSTSQQDVELQVTNFFVVSSASPNLPILLEDAERPNPIVKEQKDKVAAIEKEISEVKQEIANATSEELEAKLAALLSKKTEAQKYVILGRATRLDNRFIDLRTSANQAIMRISSAVCNLFREFLLKKDFIEIHTPKLLGTASEGGADVFKVAYFGGNAYLAQSPQLYKQMAISSDLDRVFEIGPVFRAENARTKRHMTEFVGLDLEMAIYEHYHEVLDVFDELFRFVFDGLNERFRPEIEAVRRQYPFEDLKYNSPSLKLEWPQAIKLLRDDGIEIGDYEDFSLEVERRLGQLVKRDYNVDFFMLDKFPSSVRPFYTMPSAENPELSNSYDFFIRGQEILSGAQRIHDSAMLNEKAQQHNVEIDKIQDYIDCFKYGAYPHAGGGIGLERVVMLFLDLKTVQQISMFPRTPTRLRP